MNEKFMNRKVFDNFALKANIGTTGNSNFALSQILNMYKYLTMYDGITGAELMSLANPDLKWQTTLKRNIGLELDSSGTGSTWSSTTTRTPRTTTSPG